MLTSLHIDASAGLVPDIYTCWSTLRGVHTIIITVSSIAGFQKHSLPHLRLASHFRALQNVYHDDPDIDRRCFSASRGRKSRIDGASSKALLSDGHELSQRWDERRRIWKVLARETRSDLEGRIGQVWHDSLVDCKTTP